MPNTTHVTDHTFYGTTGVFFFRDTATKLAFIRDYGLSALSKRWVVIKAKVLTLKIKYEGKMYQFRRDSYRDKYLLTGNKNVLQFADPMDSTVSQKRRRHPRRCHDDRQIQRKLARQAGVKCIPGIYYDCNYDCTYHKKYNREVIDLT